MPKKIEHHPALQALIDRAAALRRQMERYVRGETEEKPPLGESRLLTGRAMYQGGEYARSELARLLAERREAQVALNDATRAVNAVIKQKDAIRAEKNEIQKLPDDKRRTPMKAWWEKAKALDAEYQVVNKAWNKANSHYGCLGIEIQRLGTTPGQPSPQRAAETTGKRWAAAVQAELPGKVTA